MDRRILHISLLFFILAILYVAGEIPRGEGKQETASITNAVAPIFGEKEVPYFIFPTLETFRIIEEESRGFSVQNDDNKSSNVGQSYFPASLFIRKSWSVSPILRAHGALLAEAEEGGTYYFELNSGSRWPIASITKLMTAAIARDLIDEDQAITLIAEDFRSGSNSFTRELKSGDVYFARDLFRIMLLTSSNEIAEAFARVVGYDIFVEKMNEKANMWGLRATYFKDTTGVAASNQSTPEEIISLARHIRAEYPDIFAVTTQTKLAVPELNSGTIRRFSNINAFAGERNFLGGKTGQTPEAGENLISLFSYGGKTIAIVVLGTENRFEETSRLLEWFIHDFIPSN